jgi:hypothetical protein
MKLPQVIDQLIHPKPEERELFLSLLLDVDAVAAAAWYMDKAGEPHLLSHASAPLDKDDWEHRREVTDSLLSVVEDKAGSKAAIKKVVLGLPQRYLTQEGAILPSARPGIKSLTHELDLSAVGFVPVHDALAYMMKREDGVPASVIFINVSKGELAIFLYRIGKLVGHTTIPVTPELTHEVEEVLKNFQNHDVLPSRMILYGADLAAVESVKAELLKHPWTTKANFLHYPKIEVLGIDAPIGAVCFAGAKELGGIGDALESQVEKEAAPGQTPVEESHTAVGAGLQDEGDEGEEEHTQEEKEEEEVIVGGTDMPEEETNVVEVAPEDLGFKKHKDVLSEAAVMDAPRAPLIEEEGEKREEVSSSRVPGKQSMLAAGGAVMGVLSQALSKLRLLKLPPMRGRKGMIAVIGGVFVLILLFLAYWSLPKAVVTVLVSPQTIEKSTTATINPTATVVDGATTTLPGAVQEKSVTGEKTLPVTGKKDVGDPAKGTVTIYNKITSTRSLKKGTTLSSGSLQFTLDSDISVASASESIGSITFGKTDAAITASAIGEQSNLPAGSEFVFADISSSSLSGRNDQALSGGTSRQVTVVSRADQDALVKALSDELVAKAKEELASEVAGGRKLIDATVKTAVTEKTFAQELDQEAQALSGKITLSVSGLSYAEADLSSLLLALAQPDVPQGYTLAPSRITVTIKSTQAKKDGSVTLGVAFSALALPTLDEAALKAAIAGKKLDGAEVALRQFEGVAGIEVSFRLSPWKSRLPINKNNISVSVAIRE